MATQFDRPPPVQAIQQRTRRGALGRYGEGIACRHLESLGMVVLDRNWRCARGGLDIVAVGAHTLVICEVKTRTSGRFGRPEEAVTGIKLARLRMLAGMWLDAHRDVAGAARARVELPTRDIRVDVVAVLRPRRGPAVIHYFPGVG